MFAIAIVSLLRQSAKSKCLQAHAAHSRAISRSGAGVYHILAAAVPESARFPEPRLESARRPLPGALEGTGRPIPVQCPRRPFETPNVAIRCILLHMSWNNMQNLLLEGLGQVYTDLVREAVRELGTVNALIDGSTESSLGPFAQRNL